MEAIPPTGDQLVDALDQRFVARTPKPADDLSTIMFRAGQRSVIDFLRSLQNRQDS